MSAEAVIAVARADLGYTESPPGSNRTKYWESYDPVWQGQPWCVSFLWWCFRQAGEAEAFFGGGKTASCSVLLDWYIAMGQTVPVSQVQPADIVLLNFNGKGTPDHCGLVVGVDGHLVTTIEGNTTPGLEGSQDNGGNVAKKVRMAYQIVAVCRPQYKTEEPVKKDDDLTGHWYEAACRKANRKGIITGYPDGTWQPEKALTRAELATVLDRLGLLEKEAIE